MNTMPPPIIEADLHAWADGHLPPERAREVDDYLATRPDEARRVNAWRAQAQELRALFDPVLDEPLPMRLLRAARPHTPWYARRWVAGLALVALGGVLGWGLRGGADAGVSRWARTPSGEVVAAGAAFAQRAAIAHTVYAPDQRRPVEIDAGHEEQLVTWLSRRMGTPVKAPQLQALGYALEGGRLLPGGQGPVAQFMYRDGAGSRLTLYVSNEIGEAPVSVAASEPRPATAFRFAQEGALTVLYWVDGPLGYALSAQTDRAEMARVSAEVYRQLTDAAR